MWWLICFEYDETASLWRSSEKTSRTKEHYTINNTKISFTARRLWIIYFPFLQILHQFYWYRIYCIKEDMIIYSILQQLYVICVNKSQSFCSRYHCQSERVSCSKKPPIWNLACDIILTEETLYISVWISPSLNGTSKNI